MIIIVIVLLEQLKETKDEIILDKLNHIITEQNVIYYFDYFRL